jgi:DNA-binding NarL/FixJ family response regulator
MTVRNPLRVLLIDHDHVARNVLRDVLSMAGHGVVEAADGEAGLREYRERAADVVLVNLSGPRDPIEWIRRFTRDFPGCRVVAMAGPRRFGAPDPLATASSIGAAQVLRKPFGAADLLRAVEEARAREPGRKTTE